MIGIIKSRFWIISMSKFNFISYLVSLFNFWILPLYLLHLIPFTFGYKFGILFLFNLHLMLSNFLIYYIFKL